MKNNDLCDGSNIKKHNKLFHNRIAVLENTTAVLTKKINVHDKDLDVLDQALQDVLEETIQKFKKTAMMFNIHSLAMRMFNKAFVSYGEAL